MNSLLEESIEAWEDVRGGVIEEVENVPAEKFSFRPADGVRSFGELVVHILEVPLMMVGELTREDGDFTRKPYPQLIEEYAGSVQALKTKRELLAALDSTVREGIAEFRRAGELHMLQYIKRFDGKEGTRLAWFNHGVAHEMYHRGQLALYQRHLGLTPALTQRIYGS
jgi:uncharacterized damage-inducible protein DinB